MNPLRWVGALIGWVYQFFCGHLEWDAPYTGHKLGADAARARTVLEAVGVAPRDLELNVRLPPAKWYAMECRRCKMMSFVRVKQ